MSTLPPRVHVRRTSAGERWRLAGQSRLLGAGFLLVCAGLLVMAFSIAANPGGTDAEEEALTALSWGCWALAMLCALLAYGVLRSGLWLDAEGVTGRGVLVSRRLRWEDVARFQVGIEELAPNRPSAVTWAKLRDGRYVTVPGSRVEGLTFNAERHKRVAAAMAAALNERL